MFHLVDSIIFIWVGSLLILISVICALVSKVLRVIRLSRRLENYTIEPVTDFEHSFGDSVYLIGLNMLEGLSSWLSGFHFVQEYSKRYEHYQTHGEENTRSLIEFISKKVLWGIVFLGGYFILCGFKIYTLSVFWTFFFFLLGFFVPNFYWEACLRKRNHQIEEDLLKAVTMMGNSFKAGKSIVQVLEVVSHEIDGPLGEEFDRMHIDLKFGLELEMVLERFYQRIPIEEVRYITTSLIILNRTGGNIANIFASIEQNFLNRKKLKQELKSTTASASTISKILIFMPFFIVLLIRFLNPDYFDVLFKTTLGIFFLLGIIILYITYIMIIRRIMRIDY